MTQCGFHGYIRLKNDKKVIICGRGTYVRVSVALCGQSIRLHCSANGETIWETDKQKEQRRITEEKLAISLWYLMPMPLYKNCGVELPVMENQCWSWLGFLICTYVSFFTLESNQLLPKCHNQNLYKIMKFVLFFSEILNIQSLNLNFSFLASS